MKDSVKTLLKPDLKVVYLNNKVSEKVEYLEIDPTINKESLMKDIKNGAQHFRELVDFIDKKKKSQCIVITSDSKENGLMAISYISSCLNKNVQEGEGFYEEYLTSQKNPFEEGEVALFDEEDVYFEYDECASEWNESVSKVPIIEAHEIREFFNNDYNEGFSLGGFRVQQSNVINDNKPYWTECKKEAICILCDRMQGDCLRESMLQMFKKNRRVFLLFTERGMDEAPFVIPFEMDVAQLEKVKNNIILAYAADEIHVSMQDMDINKYYVNVMKQNFKNRNISVQRGFSYRRVIELAVSLKKYAMCEMLDLIINYSLKDIEDDTAVVLKNRHFDFIERFRRDEKKQTKEKAINRLETEIVGMEEVKEQVLDTINVMKYNKYRANMNISGSKYHNVHVMLGAPGTAKTTVAQLMGQIMMEERLIPNDRYICVNGAELKGEYVGHSAPKTKALFDNYDVIIIDEAYSLVDEHGTNDNFSTEAIAQLIIELEKHATDKLIVFAGYGGKDINKKDDKMRAFLEANPGIKSRITSTFYFKSYTSGEMVEIFRRLAKVANYQVDEAANEVVESFFRQRVKDKDFGNGREARSLLETSVVFAAKRLMTMKKDSYTTEELKQLKVEDVEKAVSKMKDSFGIRKANEQKQIGFAG